MLEKYYKSYHITDKNLINQFLKLDSLNLLESTNLSNIDVIINTYEKYALIDLEELYVYLDYKKAKKLAKSIG